MQLYFKLQFSKRYMYVIIIIAIFIIIAFILLL